MKQKKPTGCYFKFTPEQASSFAKLKTIPDNIYDLEPENGCFCVPKEEAEKWEAMIRKEEKVSNFIRIKESHIT
jgi:hypothetical protein